MPLCVSHAVWTLHIRPYTRGENNSTNKRLRQEWRREGVQRAYKFQLSSSFSCEILSRKIANLRTGKPRPCPDDLAPVNQRFRHTLGRRSPVVYFFDIKLYDSGWASFFSDFQMQIAENFSRLSHPIEPPSPNFVFSFASSPFNHRRPSPWGPNSVQVLLPPFPGTRRYEIGCCAPISSNCSLIASDGSKSYWRNKN